MKLYIANTTKQRHIFTFRVLESGRLRQIPITHGSQMMVHEGSTEELNAIISHHAVYGLVDASKIDQNKDFIGLCYSIDKRDDTDDTPTVSETIATEKRGKK